MGGTAVATTTALYTELSQQVRASGLLGRRLVFYWSWLMGAGVAFALMWVVFGLLGNSWFQLLVAAGLGLVATQFGFLGHDAAHRQIFASSRCNVWAAHVISSLFVGMSHAWWRTKHNRHHAAPNQEGRDPDIGPGVIAFTRAIAAQRTRGVAGWFTRYQGWLFFPLLALEGINLHVASVRPLFERRTARAQRIEAGLVFARLAAYVAVVFVILPPGKAAAFLGLQVAVLGVCLGGSFAPNHKGMPIVPQEARIDFLRRQVLMSRNVRGGIVVDTAMGGLNYQIEHHLFPSMPRPNLKRVQPMVRDYCARHGVPYTEVGLIESYRIVVDYLNHVGLRARAPFDCPLAAELRG